MLNFIHNFDPSKFSIPTLTVILGTLDGFNPCAMWALVALISVLLLTQDRKKILILGGIFLLVSAATYYLYLTAWLNVFLCLKWIYWLRYILGFFTLGVALYYLHEFSEDLKKGPECKVPTGIKATASNKIQELGKLSSFPLMIISVIALAALVNFIEMWCSLGIPVIFTNTLAAANLPKIMYYFWMLVYLFFYLLDDIIIFIIAVIFLKIVAHNSKYVRFLKLVSALLFLILGLHFFGIINFVF